MRDYESLSLPSLLAGLYRLIAGGPDRGTQFGADAPLPAAPPMRPSLAHHVQAGAHQAQQVVKVEPWLAFTPTQPRTGRRQLVGRQSEHDRILQALLEERAHVVLYSERGRGKTSLTNMVVDSLRRNGQIVARHTCDAESTFDSVIRGLANDLPSALLVRPSDDPYAEGVEAALPETELRPRDVIGLLPRLTCRSLVCVVDEFDRIEDDATRTRIADTIKQLSDRAIRLIFMIVGVSENLNQILGQHPSIQRNLAAVQLPLLTAEETSAIVERGVRQTNMTIEAGMLDQLPALVRGSPYMAQLIGLRLTQAAAVRGGTAVGEADLAAAIARLAEEAQPQDRIDYLTLTANRHDMPMVAALDALANHEQDRWGHIAVLPDAAGDAVLAGHRVGASLWQRILAAGVVVALAEGCGLYNFGRRSMMHHILLTAAQHGAAFRAPVQPNLALIAGDRLGERFSERLAETSDRPHWRASHG